MESARKDLKLMIRLQETYDRIADAIREQRTPPDDVRELQEENLRRQEELDEMEQMVETKNAELAQVTKREEESRLELEHFQKQKALVTNEREFTAVINEIDFATRALNEAGARHGELKDEIDALTADIASRRDARPDEEASHREVAQRWDARKQELTEAIHRLATETRQTEEKLQPANRSRFLRLLKNKQGKAMAPVVEGSCSLCHFELRPHLQQRVRRAQEIITCEHCHRILYLPELAGEED
ncbi:MAG: C4-type zinc ribbon domain-containing protein [Acidobacteria bacterium]|nr:C4-type zinc ribbon domain-containing protein [Acidobacteriota bacterium]